MSARRSFDRIARPYRWLEYLTLGRALERCRLYYLPELLQQRRALVLGDGDGRFLAQLLSRNPQLHADAVDSSAAMLQLLRRNCEVSTPGVSARLKTYCGDALGFIPEDEEGYDLIVTHFFLDCFGQDELDVLIAQVTPMLIPGALWVVSDFSIPSGSLRLPASFFVRALYFAFRLLTGLEVTHLPDHATALCGMGFTRVSVHYQLGGVLISEVWRRS